MIHTRAQFMAFGLHLVGEYNDLLREVLPYELLHRTLGLGSTHRVWRVYSRSAVWTLGCRYSFRVGHWDVVAYISSTKPATTSQCPTRNE